MNKVHTDVLKNQIEEKKQRGEYKMNHQEYLLNKEMIENQLKNIETS